ncbi:MAG: hypothetical protein JWQ98_2493 [Chlorobi bacterium]|nr:hypothetical protein [Chlorobiota bacterium]
MHLMNKRSLILLLLGSIICGCDSMVDPGEIEYQPRIVVNGVITVGERVDSIRFSRTLPLSRKYSEQEVGLDNVTARIETATGIYPLKPIGNGYYQATDLTPVAGREYHLLAQWEGEQVTATTVAPEIPTILRMTAELGTTINGARDPSIYMVTAYVRTHAHEVYMLGCDSYDYWSGHQVFARNYPNWVPERGDIDSNDVVSVSFLYQRPDGDNVSYPAVGRVYAYDRAYYDYWESSHSGDSRLELKDRYLPAFSETVAWNIHGDGIGMFIAKAVNTAIVVI